MIFCIISLFCFAIIFGSMLVQKRLIIKNPLRINKLERYNGFLIIFLLSQGFLVINLLGKFVVFPLAPCSLLQLLLISLFPLTLGFFVKLLKKRRKSLLFAEQLQTFFFYSKSAFDLFTYYNRAVLITYRYCCNFFEQTLKRVIFLPKRFSYLFIYFPALFLSVVILLEFYFKGTFYFSVICFSLNLFIYRLLRICLQAISDYVVESIDINTQKSPYFSQFHENNRKFILQKNNDIAHYLYTYDKDLRDVAMLKKIVIYQSYLYYNSIYVMVKGYLSFYLFHALLVKNYFLFTLVFYLCLFTELQAFLSNTPHFLNFGIQIDFLFFFIWLFALLYNSLKKRFNTFEIELPFHLTVFLESPKNFVYDNLVKNNYINDEERKYYQKVLTNVYNSPEILFENLIRNPLNYFDSTGICLKENYFQISNFTWFLLFTFFGIINVYYNLIAFIPTFLFLFLFSILLIFLVRKYFSNLRQFLKKKYYPKDFEAEQHDY